MTRPFPNKSTTLSLQHKAQMPFSMIAVLILVLSSTSIALVYSLDNEKEKASIPADILEDMVRTMDESCERILHQAYTAAAESAIGIMSLNQSELQNKFLSTLAPSLKGLRSAGDENIGTTVTHNLRLQFLSASLRESYGGQGEEATAREIASVPAYFIILGNFTVNVSCTSGMLTRTVEVEQDVYVPLPLLSYRLERLSATLSPRGEVESMVRYELAALAQYRVLHGYGSTAKTGPLGTDAVLTTDDIVRAVELAILLQELRLFHHASSKGIDSLSIGNIDPLDLAGEVDPADLFLRLSSEDGIDVTSLVAQSLLARADAIVLRWMEYLSLLTIPNDLEELYEAVEGGLWDAIDALTGGDRDRSNMASYISRSMSEAGITEANYRWYNYGGGDIVVTIPSYKVCLTNDAQDQVCRNFQGTYALDLPSIDLLASEGWGEIYQRYRSETHLIADGLRDYLEALATAIASHCTLPTLSLSLDPVDGTNYLEEIDRQIGQAFHDRSNWLTPALDHMEEVVHIRDGLAQAVIDFLHQGWTELFEVNRSVYVAAVELSGNLAAQLEGEPGFSPSSISDARDTLLMDLLGDNWGAREILQEAVRERAAPIIDRLEWGMSQRYRDIDPMIGLLAGGVTAIPGIASLTSVSVLDVIDGIESGQIARGGKATLPLYQGGLSLTLADGQRRFESIVVEGSTIRASSDGQMGSLDVEIVHPWEFERSNSSYPQRHVTDVMGMTSSPYMTQWTIGYEGELDVIIGPGSEYQGPFVRCSAKVHLASEFNVVVFSGWGLKGVVYEPTATLVGDLQGLILKAWDLLVSSVQTLGGMIGSAFTSFHELLADLITFSTESLERLNDQLSWVVDRVGEMVDGFLEGAISLAVDQVVGAMGGTVIDLTVLGLDLRLNIGPQDSALVGVTDLIRVDIDQSVWDVTIESSLRVLRLPDGDHTMIGYAVLGSEDWKICATFDPFTRICPHKVEVHGNLEGNVLELYLPEVERSKKIGLALSDIPGLGQLLNSIPSPIPGTKFHIDARMELGFNVPYRDGVMINEVELNPKGLDHSHEWVELFNPSDETVDLTGWSLVSSHGQTGLERLSGSIMAHGRIVHQFTGQFLDNGEVEGFPLQESVALLDDEGHRIDSIPWLKDLEDDERTWQRSFDGSSSWELRPHTKGTTNGPVWTVGDDLESMAILLTSCFQRSFERFAASGPDMITLRDIVVSALNELEDSLLDMVEASVSSLRFTLELGLDDATGSLGGGMFASLVYDGTAIRACLEWLEEAIGEVIRDPLNPLAAAARAPVPVETLSAHVFTEMGAFVQVGPPDLLMNMYDAEVGGKVFIACNLGLFTPLDEGTRQEVRFGLVINGVMGINLRSPFELPVRDTYDVWLLRGVVRPE